MVIEHLNEEALDEYNMDRVEGADIVVTDYKYECWRNAACESYPNSVGSL